MQRGENEGDSWEEGPDKAEVGDERELGIREPQRGLAHKSAWFPVTDEPSLLTMPLYALLLYLSIWLWVS